MLKIYNHSQKVPRLNWAWLMSALRKLARNDSGHWATPIFYQPVYATHRLEALRAIPVLMTAR